MKIEKSKPEVSGATNDEKHLNVIWAISTFHLHYFYNGNTFQVFPMTQVYLNIHNINFIVYINYIHLFSSMYK